MMGSAFLTLVDTSGLAARTDRHCGEQLGVGAWGTTS
jgi:hypothetical protein